MDNQKIPVTNTELNYAIFTPARVGNADRELIARKVSHVFTKAFWISRDDMKWPVNSIMARLTSLYLAVIVSLKSSQEPVAYGLFETAFHDNESILFIDALAVDIKYQKKGIATSILKIALKKSKSCTIAFRTQNPAMIKLILKFNPETVVPINTEYNTGVKNVLSSLAEHVVELKGVRDMNLSTGLCKRVYREGRLGDYTINMEDPVIASIENRFQKLGLQRDEGDAIVVIARDIKDETE